jgi:DNA-binding NarL/FixJ family response regulator
LATLEPCLNKPYIGLTALHIKRVVDHQLADHLKQHYTAAEMDVLRLIVGGKSNKEIASVRKRSEETIKRQLSSLYKKLGVESRTSAVAVARERGLLNH